MQHPDHGILFNAKKKKRMQGTQIQPLGREEPLKKGMASPVFLPGEFHGLRSLAGYSPQGCKESDTTERLTHKSQKIFKKSALSSHKSHGGNFNAYYELREANLKKLHTM